MMDFSLWIEGLRQAKQITPLEKDVLDTWNELQKNPFDRVSAQMQIIQNNGKYPEIFAMVAVLPTTEVRPFNQAAESDIRYNLEKQLEAFALKDGRQNCG